MTILSEKAQGRLDEIRNQIKQRLEEQNQTRKKEVGVKISNSHRVSDKHRKYLESKVTCPHCSKVGFTAIMHRWHFDRCRNKENSTNG